MDDVDHDQLLHIGEGLDLRNRELRRQGRGCSVHSTTLVLENELVFHQPVDELIDGQRSVFTIGIRSADGGDERLTASPRVDLLPQSRRETAEAVVGTRLQIDDDDLVIDRLMRDFCLVDVQWDRPGQKKFTTGRARQPSLRGRRVMLL
ncbi:MAG TPA: hypothetical protein VF701_06315 [Thermoanaerobaculia bacterium]